MSTDNAPDSPPYLVYVELIRYPQGIMIERPGQMGVEWCYTFESLVDSLKDDFLGPRCLYCGTDYPEPERGRHGSRICPNPECGKDDSAVAKERW